MSPTKEKNNPSLSRRLKRLLLLTLLAVLVIATIAAAASAYFEASDTQDETLLSVANLIETSQLDIGLIDNSKDDSSKDKHEKYKHEKEDNDIDKSAVRVWEFGKKSRYGINVRKNLKSGFHTVLEDDDLWRIYVTSNSRTSKRYIVAQRLGVSAEIALNSAFNTAWPLLLLFLLVPLIVSFLVRHSFHPLNKLTKKVGESDSVDMDLGDQENIPVEVLPFVNSIDSLLEKNSAYNQQQRRFIADAAHELRTPITALSLEIENVNSAKNDTIRHERQLGLTDSVKRLQRLVNQLLDLARIQSVDTQARQSISLNDLVRDQIAELYAMVDEKNIELAVSQNEPVIVEDINNQLQHLVRNALSNAIKFTSESGSIDVKIFSQSHNAVFEVLDNGSGVEGYQLEKLREPFFRPEGQLSGKGAGLGLAICHEISLKHKGKITLQNVKPTGFLFRYSQRQVIK